MLYQQPTLSQAAPLRLKSCHLANGIVDILDMDNGETATFLGLLFHVAPSEELVWTLEELLSN